MFVIFKRKSIGLPILMLYSMLLNAGAACIWPLTTVYIHNYLGKSLTMAGAVILLMSVFMIIGSYLGGYLFDNHSPYRTAVIFITISTLSIIALIFFHGWPAFALLMIPLGLGDGANLTLVNAYAAVSVSHSNRYIFNIMYIGLNLGMVIGTATVGYLLKGGVTFLFSITTLFYLATLLLTIFYFNVDFSNYQPVKRQVSHHHRSFEPHMILLLSICALVFCVYLSYSLWESVMPVHMTDLGISFEKYSWIWVVNGLMIVAGQALVNRIFSRTRIAVQVALGIVIFALAFYALVPAHHYLAFIGIMIFLTIGEMISLPDIPAWIDDLAPLGEKGRYQAYFNVAMTIGRAVGPVFGGVMVESLSYGFLFGLCATLILVALGWVLTEVSQIHRRKLTSDING